MSPNNGLLFDTSPVEDEDSRKKKRAKRANIDEAQPRGEIADFGDPTPYMLSIEGHTQCDRCGIPVVDLVRTAKVEGRVQWLVTCGWWCGTSWWIEPIPGLLDKADETAFVLREGLFAGQTLDQVWKSGNEWYVESLVTLSKRRSVAAAAAEYLAGKKIDAP